MQGFVGEKEDLEGNAVFYGKPVKLLQGGGDVLPGFGTGENPSSGVLHILEPGKGLAGNTVQNSVAVVQS